MNEKKMELAKALAENWVRNFTLSGRMAFIANEKAKDVILAEATALGIREDVYDLANDILHGRVAA